MLRSCVAVPDALHPSSHRTGLAQRISGFRKKREEDLRKKKWSNQYENPAHQSGYAAIWVALFKDMFVLLLQGERKFVSVILGTDCNLLGTGMDTQDTSPSVLLFFDKQRFKFNAGEVRNSITYIYIWDCNGSAQGISDILTH
ncbi:unnamed protein product [Prunus armeniaca]